MKENVRREKVQVREENVQSGDKAQHAGRQGLKRAIVEVPHPHSEKRHQARSKASRQRSLPPPANSSSGSQQAPSHCSLFPLGDFAIDFNTCFASSWYVCTVVAQNNDRNAAVAFSPINNTNKVPPRKGVGLNPGGIAS